MRQVGYRFDIFRQHTQAIWVIQYRIVPIAGRSPFRYARFHLRRVCEISLSIFIVTSGELRISANQLRWLALKAAGEGHNEHGPRCGFRNSQRPCVHL